MEIIERLEKIDNEITVIREVLFQTTESEAEEEYKEEKVRIQPRITKPEE